MSWRSSTESSTDRISTGPGRPRWTERTAASACRPRTDGVRFELKEHYASEEAARFAVEAHYILNWEFAVCLVRGPNAFALCFDRSEIVDRDPPPGPPTLSARASLGRLTATANLAPPRPPSFPEPPSVAIKRSPDVDTMYQHYLRHLGGGEPLSAMAYFCLTKLEQMAGGRDAAAVRFGISKQVLRRIGELSTNKGGASARKAVGQAAPYTPEEERFLKSAIRTLIRRAAEVEYGPDPNRSQITLDEM